MAATPNEAIVALRASHDRLVRHVEALGPDGVEVPSYCTEWSIAQVLSHLGSGAEIALAILDAAVRGVPAPSRDRYSAVWATWDARSPEEMATTAILADQQLVSRLEAFDDATLDTLHVPWFAGGTVDVATLASNRLMEHALHTWDIEVVGDPAATVAPSSATVLAGLIGRRLARLGRGTTPELAPTAVAVATSSPALELRLQISTEGVAEGEHGDAPTTFLGPTEAFLRLVFGRLDAGHTPADVECRGALNLDDLRALFPGT